MESPFLHKHVDKALNQRDNKIKQIPWNQIVLLKAISCHKDWFKISWIRSNNNNYIPNIIIRNYKQFDFSNHSFIFILRTCNSYQDFLHRSVLLTRKFLSQGFIETSWDQHLNSVLVVTITWHCLIASQWPSWLMTSVGHDIVVKSTFHSLIRHRGTSWRVSHAKQEMIG